MHKKLLCIFLFAPLFFVIQAQDTFELTGTTMHNDLPIVDVHVINKSFDKYTITDVDGNFDLMARVGDTIVFSAVQFELKTVVLASKDQLDVILVERVNELDEVVLYNKLSGNPALDMKNSGVKKPINFYDIGIPGYTGRKLTKEERKIYAATTGGGIIPLTPILNAISGRTKMLKERLKLQNRRVNTEYMQNRYEQLFIDVYHLPKEKGFDFFDYCAEDIKFSRIATSEKPLEQLDFLIEKYKKYKKDILAFNE